MRRLAADGVTQVSLLGQNVNSYGRDLALAARREGVAGAGATGSSGVAGARGGSGPMFSDLLRAVGAVPGIRRVRYVSPHPKDMRRDVLDAMAETPSVCEHLHYPLQSGSDAVLAAMHRGYTASRYLARLAEARARIDDLAVTTDVIVGFPGETEADFAATLEVCAEAGFDAAYSFVFSPRPGTAAAEMTDRFVDPGVVRDRYDRLKVVLDRTALARHRERIGRVEEVVVEGRSKKDPARLTGRTRQHKLVHFSVDGLSSGAGLGGPVRGPGRWVRRCRSARTRASRSWTPRDSTSRGGSSRWATRRVTARASRSRWRERSRRARGRPMSGAARPPVVILGPTASGKSDVAMAVARGAGMPAAAAGAGAGGGAGVAAAAPRVEIVACDAMQVYRGMDVGTAKPTAADRAAVPHHCLDLAEPTQRHTVADYQAAARVALAGVDARGARALIVAGTGLYLTAVIDDLELPGEWPDVRAELEAEPSTARLLARLAELDPVTAARVEAGNRRRIERALEVCIGSGRAFSSFGPGTAAYPDRGVVQIGILWEREALAGRIEARVRAMLAAGLVAEVRALAARGPLSREARQALGYREILDWWEGDASGVAGRDDIPEAVVEAIVTHTRQFAVRQERWFRRDPRVQWVRVERDPVAEVAPVVARSLA